MSTMPAVLSKMIGDKRRWRQYKARTRQLPENYRTAIDAVERYLMYAGGRGDGPGWGSMLEDLAELFGQWITRQRERLNKAIERAACEDTGNEERAIR